MASIEIILLALFTLVMAVAALETEKITTSILFLALSSVGIGSIFFFVGASYAAVFEFLVYAGVLIVLFIVTASLTETSKPITSTAESPFKDIEP
ncbi:hypothetical protein CEE45_12035 [Candidatus Heimdallarchaeota archaeon B3_Heim]|nr:MAG: hypothetical protein CEE45_12035 [Candidatus Heimdallarchaeota archaeon B3_Heim]